MRSQINPKEQVRGAMHKSCWYELCDLTTLSHGLLWLFELWLWDFDRVKEGGKGGLTNDGIEGERM